MEMEKQMFEKQMFETVGERVVDSDLGLAELPPRTKPVFFADATGDSSVLETDLINILDAWGKVKGSS